MQSQKTHESSGTAAKRFPTRGRALLTLGAALTAATLRLSPEAAFPADVRDTRFDAARFAKWILRYAVTPEGWCRYYYRPPDLDRNSVLATAYAAMYFADIDFDVSAKFARV